MTPNLNDLKTRIEYVVNGGKVTREDWDGECVYYNDRRFGCSDGGGAPGNFFENTRHTWLPYSEPVNVDKLESEFAELAQAKCWHNLFHRLFDTFALKEK